MDGTPSRNRCGLRRSRLSFSFITLAAVLVAALGSCIKDDRSDCVDEDDTTLTILFEYRLPDGSERFSRYIEDVDLYIFDAYKNFYMQISADKSSLGNFQGVRVSVEPGDYYLVAWGNTGAGTYSQAGDAYGQMSLIHDPAAATTGPLYYAPDMRESTKERSPNEPLMITVTENENNVHTLGFMGAHHTIEIYIKGMSESDSPQAAVSGLPAGYDYSLGLLDDRTIEFRSGTGPIVVDDEPLMFATFCIPHLHEMFPVTAAVTAADKINGSVQVQQYITDNDIEITDGNPGVIPILFEYRDDTFVQVSFPGWLGNEVIGGFNR